MDERIEKLYKEMDRLTEEICDVEDKINQWDEVPDHKEEDLENFYHKKYELVREYNAVSLKCYELERKDRNMTKVVSYEPPIPLWKNLGLYKIFPKPGSRREARHARAVRRRIKRFERNMRTVHISTRISTRLHDCKYHSIYIHSGSSAYIDGGSRIVFAYVENGATLYVKTDKRYRVFNPNIHLVVVETGGTVLASPGTIEACKTREEMFPEDMPKLMAEFYWQTKFNRKPMRGPQLKSHLRLDKYFREKYMEILESPRYDFLREKSSN